VKRYKAFTLIELLVVVAIIALLISILLPSLSKARELAKRSVCAANLGGMGKAVAMYGAQAKGSFPQATKARWRATQGLDVLPTPAPVKNTATTDGWICFFDMQKGTGFTPGGPHRWQQIVGGDKAVTAKATTQIKDAAQGDNTKDTKYAFPTREMYMLVKGNYGQVAQFVCPSTAHEADPMWGDRNAAPHDTVATDLGLNNPTDAVPPSQLWDFLAPDNLDYGYMWGHDMNGEALNESMDPQCALMADSNPYMRKQVNLETYSGSADPVINKKMGDNSPNHNTEGQNVLYGDLHAQFYDHPTVGVGTDNIYTWWYSKANQSDITKAEDEAPRASAGIGAGSDAPQQWKLDLVSRTDCLLMP
jgi:prepilin-type N-terminal cleavage/methylation domain-containing protein